MRIARWLLLTGIVIGLHAEITFTRDVAPVLYKQCVGCHRPGDIAPMSLLTYKDARPWAAAIREAVVSRKMPPWLADPTVGRWSNDPRLSDAEIQKIRDWAAGPKLEGNPKDMPPAPVFSDGWKIGIPTQIELASELKIRESTSGKQRNDTRGE